ncbi:hypothetical protein A33M_1355 [Rhodovulum sp. PH10]|nr:hypothetical protein A33M_1355 [Rhodovulum sp. PH10]
MRGVCAREWPGGDERLGHAARVPWPPGGALLRPVATPVRRRQAPARARPRPAVTRDDQSLARST